MTVKSKAEISRGPLDIMSMKIRGKFMTGGMYLDIILVQTALKTAKLDV